MMSPINLVASIVCVVIWELVRLFGSLAVTIFVLYLSLSAYRWMTGKKFRRTQRIRPIYEAGQRRWNSRGDVRTISIIAATSTIHVDNFTRISTACLANITPTTVFSTRNKCCDFGDGQHRPGCQLGRIAEFVVLNAAGTDWDWSKMCLERANLILILIDGTVEPRGPADRLFWLLDRINTRVAFVLLWPNATKKPRNTTRWLDEIPNASSHFHLRAPGGILDNEHMGDTEIRTESERVTSDFCRLARTVTGNAIGLVLGGGGARGAAHVGVLEVMLKNDIPIDYIGGNSIGSCIGALYANSSGDFNEFKSGAAMICEKLAPHWSVIFDLTIPFLSCFTGASFNEVVYSAFGDAMFEDTWIPFYCVTTDISISDVRYHRSGYLWRYVRASMSLAGIVPPICNFDRHLLVDGGYTDNTPDVFSVDGMIEMGIQKIIVVDVGAPVTSNILQYGDEVDGWFLLFRKVIKQKMIQVISLMSLQLRLSFMGSERRIRYFGDGVVYIRPAIDQYGLLEFSKFNDILKTGKSGLIEEKLLDFKTTYLAAPQQGENVPVHDQDGRVGPVQQ